MQSKNNCNLLRSYKKCSTQNRTTINYRTIAGVRTTKHEETPGLGDKVEVKKSLWITTFKSLTVEGEEDARWAVKKDGGQFDQFTGATITPRAVVGSVKNAVLFAQTNFDDIFAAPNAECMEVAK